MARRRRRPGARGARRRRSTLVRATGESPQQLFGSASEHADALQDQWVAEGRLVLADSRDRWPEVVRFGLGMSVAYAVLLGVVTWVRGDLTGTGSAVQVVLIALTIGMGSSVVHGLWTRRHHRRAPGIDALGTDRAWSLELTEILRSRYAMSGARVRRIVADADAHARETGRSGGGRVRHPDGVRRPLRARPAAPQPAHHRVLRRRRRVCRPAARRRSAAGAGRSWWRSSRGWPGASTGRHRASATPRASPRHRVRSVGHRPGRRRPARRPPPTPHPPRGRSSRARRCRPCRRRWRCPRARRRARAAGRRR